MATTITNLGEIAYQEGMAKIAEEEKKKSPKQLCKEKGGFWDEKTQTCSMFKPTTTTQTEETPTLTKVKSNPKNLPVVTDRFGNEKLLTEDERKKGIKEAEKLAVTKGGLGSAEALKIKEEQVRVQQRNAQLLQMAQSGLLSQEELSLIPGANIDIGQALGAGAASAVPGVIGGVIGGATIGALGGPIGAVGGAIVGGVGSFVAGIISNVRSQTSGEFSADQTALTKGERYLRSLITDTNQNPQNAPENIALFYKTLSMIDAAHAKTWKDSRESLNKFLGKDGTEQLAKFETFNLTMRQYYIAQLEAALLQPNPSVNLMLSEDLAGVEE